MEEFNERDLFAAFAMNGLIAHHGVLYNKKFGTSDDESGANRAYEIADAMIKEKEKRDERTSN
jgi:hypothetical protein